MDSTTVTDIKWRELDAWMIAAERLEVVAMRIGGHIAALRIPGENLNPLWQPNWPACEPEEAATRPDFYGEGIATLLGTIVGLNLCLDRFGAPWPGENKPVHGEAGAMRWSLDSADSSLGRVRLSCSLPQAKLDVVRSLAINDDVLTVTTEVSRVDGSAAEIEWAEHVTLGDPFLENATITAGVDKAWLADRDDRRFWRFQGMAPDTELDIAQALSMPDPSGPPTGDMATCRVTQGWFRAERKDLGRSLEVRWDKDEFPWLCLWTQNKSRTTPPWNGGTRAKGLEFSTKPIPEGKPPESRATVYHGIPTKCSIPAGKSLVRTMTLRWGPG